MFVGSLMLLIGMLMLLDRLGYLPGDWWDYFWPLAIMALGISMVLRHRNNNKYVG